ncbi:MAG TPA: aminodeoxychorismate/anthranilate synthase component II [Deltaproteobacteria bacterium]|nr:aminodeoxychorismate/anthranilate synthase component II [Candidatus Binatota bacterium]HIL12962.1 aminodeoxychorismate/anthranilate synthase component II [Deltaproteobacteria bacterium]
MLVMVDNYDSFTWNLVQYLGELGADVVVHRNDEVTPEEIEQAGPRGVVVSPGPCTPREAGISVEVVRRFAGKLPVLGVCLGHQCIASAFGGKVVRADRLMHGKTSPVEHDGQGVFKDLPQGFIATRYHSLVVERESLPAELEVSAWTAEGEIMGIRHKQLQVEGVQFHPESILTSEGKALLGNFLGMVTGGESGP